MKKMKMTKRITAAILAGMLAVTMLGGCSKAGETSSEVSEIHEQVNSALPSEPSSEPEESSEPEPEAEVDIGLRNPLTGEADFSETAVGMRPVTVMINNIGMALPQRGLAAADVIYEAVVEGGITRMMAVYADIDQIPYVGPVRSARHYYVAFSEGLNAIYTHFGGSPVAYNYISQYGVDDVDGQYCTSAFYQDTWRAQTYGREHSFFIDGETIRAQAENKGIDLTGECAPLFDFSYDEVIVPEEGAADDVYVPISGSYNAEFIYDDATGLYSKKRNGADHIDADTEEVITFTNVLILYTTVSALGDGTERRNLDLSSGSGWYISAGAREAISWEKGDVENQFSFTGSDGEPLTVNVGKTYICITDKGNSAYVTFTGE